jgi:hypothetical protein
VTEIDVRTIVSLLASTRQLSSVPIRVFLTGRLELPIQLGFTQVGAESHRDEALYEIPSSTIQHDISVYLESEFSRIREEHNHVRSLGQLIDPNWPGRQTLESLIHLSVPLFIVAATIARFVSEHYGDLHDHLATFLSHLEAGQMTDIEETYLSVLLQILIKVKEPQERQNML